MDEINARFAFSCYARNGDLLATIKIHDRFMEIFSVTELKTIMDEFDEVINKRLRSDEENQFLKLLEDNPFNVE